MNKFCMGYQRLSSWEKDAYVRIEKALRNYQRTCDIYVPSDGDAFRIAHTVIDDNPDILFFTHGSITVETHPLFRRVIFNKCIDKARAQKKERELEKSLEHICRIIKQKAHSKRDVLVLIYACLQRYAKYDFDELKKSSQAYNLPDPYDAYTAYGVLVNHYAVCDGFSSAFCLIGHRLGINCMKVYGRSRDDALSEYSFQEGRSICMSKSQNSSIEENHAWNIVEYEGYYYQLDVTWDGNTARKTRMYSFGYFCIPDNIMRLSHKWDRSRVPKCDHEDLMYYKFKSLRAENDAQLQRLLIDKMKAGEGFSIQIGYRVKGNMELYVDKSISKAMKSVHNLDRCSYMWNQRTMCLYVMISN